MKNIVKASDTLYVIPFHLVDDLAIIKISINGSDSLNFIFDTGTTTTLLDSTTADRIGIITEETRALLLSNDYVELPIAKVSNVKTGNYLIRKSYVIIQRSFENYNRILGFPIHGVIGEDIFEKYYTELDFENSEIHLHTNPDTTGYFLIKTETYNDLFYLKATIHVSDTVILYDRFLFDSADLSSISIAEPFWKKNKLLQQSKNFYSGINRSSSITTTPSYFAKLDGFSIADNYFTGFYANLTAAKRGFFANDSIAGTIGIDIIKRFNSIIDLKHKQLYLKPNNKKNDLYRTNTTGLRARLDKSLTNCVIEAVLSNSPAFKAGIEINDIIVSVNNVEANAHNITYIRQMIRAPKGTCLSFVIKRGLEQKQFDFIANEFSDN